MPPCPAGFSRYAYPLRSKYRDVTGTKAWNEFVLAIDQGRNVQARVWDEFLLSSGQAHLLQCSAWADFKAHFGWDVLRVLYDGPLGDAGFQLLHRQTPLGRIAYVGRGPVDNTSTPEGAAAALNAVSLAARQLGVIYVMIEPNSTGFSAEVEGQLTMAPPLQPPTTIKVDIRPSEAEILARFKPKTRYNVRLAMKKGVTVRPGDAADLAGFYALMQETGERDRFLIRPLSYYRLALEALGNNACLLVAEHEGVMIAANIVMGFGPEAIYMYGASGNQHRNLMPTYLLQWEGMRWAKSAGFQTYDLWGIPEDASGEEAIDEIEERRGGLWGVYRFKRGFGGEVFRYTGARDLVLSPWRYRLWTVAVPRLQKIYHRLFVRGSATAARDA